MTIRTINSTLIDFTYVLLELSPILRFRCLKDVLML